MTTYRTEGVVLVDGASSLDGRTRAIDCYDWSDLWRVGPSRGFNRIIPGQPGTRPRAHVRGELPVTLSWRLHGGWNTDGEHDPSDGRARLLDHIDMLMSFVDGADGRQLELTLYDPDGDSSTVDVTFKTVGRLRPQSALIVEVDMLLAVPDGRVPRPSPGAPT